MVMHVKDMKCFGCEVNIPSALRLVDHCSSSELFSLIHYSYQALFD